MNAVLYFLNLAVRYGWGKFLELVRAYFAILTITNVNIRAVEAYFRYFFSS